MQKKAQAEVTQMHWLFSFLLVAVFLVALFYFSEDRERVATYRSLDNELTAFVQQYAFPPGVLVRQIEEEVSYDSQKSRV